MTKVIQNQDKTMRETVKTVKTPMKNRVIYEPKDEEEKRYIESLETLLSHKRHGDWKLVGKIVGITSASAEKAFLRVYQKNHFEVVEALKKVIDNRKQLLNQ